MGKIKQPFKAIKLNHIDLLKIAYNAGRNAYSNNVRLFENPYKSEGEKKEWENGWLDKSLES